VRRTISGLVMSPSPTSSSSFLPEPEPRVMPDVAAIKDAARRYAVAFGHP
jgi:hypothetical protein